MSEWLTYSLADFLLFAPRTYYRLFALYNEALWPGHVLALAAGLAILVLLWRGGRNGGRIAAALLAACWLWVAWAWLLQRYDTINWAARYFAVSFAVEALLLLGLGTLLGRCPLERSAATWAGLLLVLFALVGQPLIGPALGRPWAQAELFALTPGPTVVATLGFVLTRGGRAKWALLPVPLIWCVIDGATLWAMESPDALVLPAAALLTLVAAAARARRR